MITMTHHKASRLTLGQQRGAALLLFVLVLVGGGAALVLNTWGNTNTLRLDLQQATQQAMKAASEQLIAYAIHYDQLYTAPGSAGPGHLMCPDTNNNGSPNPPCGLNTPGRLPRNIVLPSGGNYPLSEHGAGTDQRLWYAVAPAFRNNPIGAVNTTTSGSFTLDGLTDIVAIVLAPGRQPASGPSNTPADYLDPFNATADGQFTRQGDDDVLPIFRHDILSALAAILSGHIWRILEAQGYPADQATFNTLMDAQAPGWYAANQWHTVTSYTSPAANTAQIGFTDCAISYTLDNSGIQRSQPHC